ncbi:hypothetical protein KBB89_03795 [Candidatus Gracilibacteria bacterium]|nr:hypothetical protein [Candidatus Gracilibacteria bacterium]
MIKTIEPELTPLIKRKYFSILIITAVGMFFTPSYVAGDSLYAIGGLAGVILLCTWGLYRGFRFQKIQKKLRPFIVTRILQICSAVLFILVILNTAQTALAQNTWLPHIVYWAIMLAIGVQFFGIFSLAKEAKKKYPDRCEFC